MNTIRHSSWQRQGVSLLWSPQALARVVELPAVVSMHQYFRLQSKWPSTLPATSGDALVVAGLEGCLDALAAADAERWLEEDLRSSILEFQDHYAGQAALLFWLPSGRKRITMDSTDESYRWRSSVDRSAELLPLGRCLFGGAEADVARILDSTEKSPDLDGDAYVGLHLQRIS